LANAPLSLSLAMTGCGTSAGDGAKLPNYPGTVSIKSSAGAIAFSPDGTKLAISTGSLDIWDALTGEHLQEMEEAHGTRSIDYSPDGKKSFPAE